MDKLKKYNLIILAVIGTLLLIYLIIGGGVYGYEMLTYNSSDDTWYEPGIISEEVTDSLILEEKRKQIITFNKIELIDSVNRIYLIPVSHRNLENDESTGELLGLTNQFIDNYDPRRYKSGVSYNNLIVYNSSDNISKIIFENRISISDFLFIKNMGNQYVLIRGTNEDSNKDGYVDSYDIQELFVYDIRQGKILEIKTKEGLSYINFADIKRDGELIIQFGVDRNKNGEYDIKFEPKIYYKLDLLEGGIIPIVTEGQINNLQKLLEGSKFERR